ncbi:MAG: PTS sugar transporter subunit IIA [Planctomycetota bacterium]
MKLLDFLVRAATRYELASAGKQEAIEELVRALVEAGALGSGGVVSVVDALMKREELGSTGIGMGVAIPHTKTEATNKLVGMVGRSSKGVEFKAIDGEPVHVFFLVLSPPNKPAEHLKALEQISCLVRDDHFCRFMKNAKSLEELNDILQEADEKLFS